MLIRTRWVELRGSQGPWRYCANTSLAKKAGSGHLLFAEFKFAKDINILLNPKTPNMRVNLEYKVLNKMI